ncbi:MAG: lysylphosphatidylglycerol synthase transmembrane domain-containing protein [Clostridia bacterium]
MKNKNINLIIVVIAAFIFVSFFVFSNGLNNLVKQVQTLNIAWIIVAILCIISFWLFEALVIYIITKLLYPSSQLLVKSIKFAMIGQFFSAITPFQSGSQPAQIYSMTKNGIPVGSSSSILMIKFIIHQATLTIYSLLMIIFKFNYFNSKISNFIYFCVFGFLINTVIIVFAVLFSVNSEATKKIIMLALRLLQKIRVIKDLTKTQQRLEGELISFHENSAFIAKNIWMCIYTSLLTFIQWTAYYAIPYCIYRSFGFSSADIWTMIAAQVFLTMFMSFIPLPGAAVGAEGGFYIIFGIFFKSDSLVPALFLWRVITYYAAIAAGSIFTVILSDKDDIINMQKLS